MRKRLNITAGLIVGVLAMTLGASSYAEEVVPSVSSDAIEHPEFKSLNDRFSYAYGMDLAEKFKVEGIDLNPALMAEAMQAVFSDGERKMSKGEIVATMELYRKVHLQKKDAEWAAASVKNKEEGDVFLKSNAQKQGIVTTETGLQYKVLASGHGNAKPGMDDEVKVHYRARFVDGSEFDSTYDRNEPYSVKAKQLIDGWAEALQMMTEGAKWEVYIPANLAYGEKGSPPHVGPNAVLIFEVELLDIENKS